MRFWKRRPKVNLGAMWVVSDEGMERATREARTVREKRWTLTPEMMDTVSPEVVVRECSGQFEYVTMARFERPAEDPTRPDDGRSVLVMRGVLRDE